MRMRKMERGDKLEFSFELLRIAALEVYTQHLVRV